MQISHKSLADLVTGGADHLDVFLLDGSRTVTGDVLQQKASPVSTTKASTDTKARKIIDSGATAIAELMFKRNGATKWVIGEQLVAGSEFLTIGFGNETGLNTPFITLDQAAGIVNIEQGAFFAVPITSAIIDSLTINNDLVIEENAQIELHNPVGDPWLNPPLCGYADLDTGLYPKAANQMGASAGGAPIWFWRDTGIVLEDGKDIITNATTGSKYGRTNLQKLGKWGVTPIVRPTTGHAAAAFTANAGTAVNDASTFDGYTIKQVVKALRDAGNLT